MLVCSCSTGTTGYTVCNLPTVFYQSKKHQPAGVFPDLMTAGHPYDIHIVILLQVNCIIYNPPCVGAGFSSCNLNTRYLAHSTLCICCNFILFTNCCLPQLDVLTCFELIFFFIAGNIQPRGPTPLQKGCSHLRFDIWFTRDR